MQDRYQPFDPQPYKEQLLPLLTLLCEVSDGDRKAIENLLRRFPKDGRGFFSRSELIAAIRHFAPQANWSRRQDELVAKLRMRPVRSQSGVTPVTVLTKPFPCPGRCIFCPNDVRMPKSYLSDEPGAQRAAMHAFDPYLQAYQRIHTYYQIGHSVDKIELIVLGGTWSYYPEIYQIWFIQRLFDAMNDFAEGLDRRTEVPKAMVEYESFSSRAAGGPYNDQVNRALREGQAGKLLQPWEESSWSQLQRVQRENENSNVRCVGLVLETRPDCIDEKEAIRMRRLGVTKIQLGYQSLSDEVLEVNQRGHDVAASRRATQLLRQMGFKIHGHWMANLLGATPENDIADFEALFRNPDFRPDELKLYPCSLIADTELEKAHDEGRWKPYNYEELLHVVSECLAKAPAYCRLTRVIRDIPSTDILVGNQLTNFREIAERTLDERGVKRQEIRSREIRDQNYAVEALQLSSVDYRTSVGQECFLQFITADGSIVAFLRLCLPTSKPFIDELLGAALIREVHVYGPVVDVGEASSEASQHRGLGRRLIDEATRIAKEKGFARLAVISAIGTREYYRKLGFHDGELYQNREL